MALRWPRRITIVRHGLSELNVAKMLEDAGNADELKRLAKVRDMDISLVETGRWQADKTGEYLATTEPFDVIYSSPYRRTVQTAEHIKAKLPYDVAIRKDNRLREKEFGFLHGMPEEEIERMFPFVIESRKRDGKYWHRLFGGENYPDVEMRLHSMLDTLHRDWAGRSVLITTHHVPYLLFRGLYEHLDEHQLLALGDVPNCGVQEYHIDTSKREDGRMKLAIYDHVAYDMDEAPNSATY